MIHKLTNSFFTPRDKELIYSTKTLVLGNTFNNIVETWKAYKDKILCVVCNIEAKIMPWANLLNTESLSILDIYRIWRHDENGHRGPKCGGSWSDRRHYRPDGSGVNCLSSYCSSWSIGLPRMIPFPSGFSSSAMTAGVRCDDLESESSIENFSTLTNQIEMLTTAMKINPTTINVNVRIVNGRPL